MEWRKGAGCQQFSSRKEIDLRRNLLLISVI